MTDRLLHKIIDGNYTVAGYNVVRDGRSWILIRHAAANDVFPTRRLAVLAARVLAGVASESESNELARFYRPQEA